MRIGYNGNFRWTPNRRCTCTGSHSGRIVKNLITSDGDKHRISVLLALLRKDFINSANNANNRKGGLLGLAAAAIALGQV